MIKKIENNQKRSDKEKINRKAEVLELLRKNFGKERYSNNLESDYQGFGLIQTFLRIKSTEDSSEESGIIDKNDLPEARRRWKEQKKIRNASAKKLSGKDDNDGPADSHVHLDNDFSYHELIKELPQLREHFSNWLSNSTVDLLPCSTTMEELENMRARIEFRLRALKIALSTTQKELDNLIIVINALIKK